MTLSRQHFNFIAETLKNLDIPKEIKVKVSKEFADELRFTNPNFDKTRFLEACLS